MYSVDCCGRAFRLRTPLAVFAGVLLVVAAFISYRQFVPPGPQQEITAERAVAANPSSAISIAVLPFLNLSGDVGQEFFSDGMTEEITSALAMVPDLKVVARTSAFQFKGEKHDMRAVGKALNATHLDRRLGAQGRRPRAYHRAAHRSRQGDAPLERELRPPAQRYFCDPGRDRSNSRRLFDGTIGPGTRRESGLQPRHRSGIL